METFLLPWWLVKTTRAQCQLYLMVKLLLLSVPRRRRPPSGAGPKSYCSSVEWVCPVRWARPLRPGKRVAITCRGRRSFPMMSLWALTWHRGCCCCRNRKQQVLVETIWFTATWRAAAQELLLVVGSKMLFCLSSHWEKWAILFPFASGSWWAAELRGPQVVERYKVSHDFSTEDDSVASQHWTTGISLTSNSTVCAYGEIWDGFFPHTWGVSILVEGNLTLMEHWCSAATSPNK